MARLSPDTLLSVHLDAICSRNRHTSEPTPVIAELIKTAGEQTDILAEAVGTWVGYFEDDRVSTLCTALRELPGLEPWIALGQRRRAMPDHRTPPPPPPPPRERDAKIRARRSPAPSARAPAQSVPSRQHRRKTPGPLPRLP